MKFKKRGAREIVWGPEEPWVEPKKEVILGPAGTPTDVTGASSSENASALGFLGAMAAAAEPSSSSAEERPKSSPYGWEPSSNISSQSSSDYSSSSDSFSSSSEHVERLERLHRKLEYVSDRLEEIERKMRQVQEKLGLNNY
jgi:hypothetical protein